jgi:hypothetical protein
MHDVGPAHFNRDVKQFSDSHYPGRWIRRNGLVLWLPRSPDLTPADFYLWGHLKAIVYSERVVALGGVVVSVLATGPKVRGFKPGRGRWILRVIKSVARLPSEGK